MKIRQIVIQASLADLLHAAPPLFGQLFTGRAAQAPSGVSVMDMYFSNRRPWRRVPAWRETPEAASRAPSRSRADRRRGGGDVRQRRAAALRDLRQPRASRRRGAVRRRPGAAS